jgi:hypothetical protein
VREDINILSPLRVGGDDRLLLTGVSGAGRLLTLEGAAFFGFILIILWCVQTRISSSTQQPGLKGGISMGKLLRISIATLLANAATALYVNNLPALSIQAVPSLQV